MITIIYRVIIWRHIIIIMIFFKYGFRNLIYHKVFKENKIEIHLYKGDIINMIFIIKNYLLYLLIQIIIIRKIIAHKEIFSLNGSKKFFKQIRKWNCQIKLYYQCMCFLALILLKIIFKNFGIQIKSLNNSYKYYKFIKKILFYYQVAIFIEQN